jgi:hypothetical protein
VDVGTVGGNRSQSRNPTLPVALQNRPTPWFWSYKDNVKLPRESYCAAASSGGAERPARPGAVVQEVLDEDAQQLRPARDAGFAVDSVGLRLHRRKPNRPCEPKVWSGRKASDARGPVKAQPRAVRTSLSVGTGFGGVWQEIRGAAGADVRSGVAAPSVAEEGGYQETRQSNSKSGSGWPTRSQSGRGSGASSQAGGGDRRWA